MAVRHTLEQERRFYVVASVLLLLATVVGFREFLLHGKGAGGIAIKPQILATVVFHGIVMLVWVALLLLQSLLVLTGRRRLHMTLGALGGLVAIAVVLSGLAVAPLAARYNPEGYEVFGGARYFLAFSLTAPVVFGVLVSIGFAWRGKPAVHRPMMLLATVAMMTGSFDRWPYLERLITLVDGYVPVVHWGPMLLFGALLFALHAAMTRKPNPWFAIGYTGVFVATLLATAIAGSATWNDIASLVAP